VRALLCIAPTAPVTHAYSGSRSNNSTRLCSQSGYNKRRASNFHRPVRAGPTFGLFFLTGFHPIDCWEKAAQLTNFLILPVAVTEAEQSSKIHYSVNSIAELLNQAWEVSRST
jgi:hypothetical protein